MKKFYIYIYINIQVEFHFIQNLNPIGIKIFINLEIIGEEDKYKKNYIYFFKIIKKKILQFGEAI